MNYFTTEKAYNTLDNYYKKTYNSKVFKVSLDAGFSCPNKLTGGCTFCNDGSAAHNTNKNKSLEEQFSDVKEVISKKWKDAKLISYFQANTNTYESLEKLIPLYEKAITLDEDIVGLNISTRPDCINEDLVKYLASLNQKTDVVIELGLQTTNDDILKSINRGHTYQDFLDALKLLNKYQIKVVVHIINGLRGETKKDMLETAKKLSKLQIFGIKIHMLHITRNTIMAKEYQEDPFHILTLEEYVDITVSQIELLNQNIIINRLSSDANSDDLITPLWINKKLVVMNEIDKEFRKRKTHQGIYYQENDLD